MSNEMSLQLNELLCDGTKAHLLAGKIDQVLMAVYFQLGLVLTTHMADDATPQQDVARMFQSIASLLLTVRSLFCSLL